MSTTVDQAVGAAGGPGDSGPSAAAAPAAGRRLRAPAWLPVLPFFGYAALFLGLPVSALVYGAFRRTDPVTHHTSYTFANVTASWHGINATSLWGSLRLSLAAAIVSTIFGTLLGQAIVAGRRTWLKNAILTASGVLANFGGIPLAFCFIATIGTNGEVISLLHHVAPHFQLGTFTGVVLVYPYFMIPLMVLVIVPALEGVRPQWREATQNLGGTDWQFWRYVGGPVLFPAILGGAVLNFGYAFAAYATASALTNGTVPLITTRIASVLSGNVIAGQENIGMALSLNMILVCAVMVAVYLPLRRRSARWLG